MKFIYIYFSIFFYWILRLSAWSAGELSFWKWPNCSLTSHISIFSNFLLIHNFSQLFQIISWRSFSIRLRIVFRCPSLSTPSSIRSSLVRSFRCSPSISFFVKFSEYCPKPFSESHSQTSTTDQLEIELCSFRRFFAITNCLKSFKIMSHKNYISYIVKI